MQRDARQTIRTPGWLAAAMAAAMVLAGGCQRQPDHASLETFLQVAQAPVGSTEYRVMPPDVIRITARPSDEYTGLRVMLAPDGKAALPLLGEVQLANKTVTEIAAELTDALHDYYQDIEVTVAVVEFRSQRYFVFGQVARPGSYPYTGGDTVLSALAQAQPTSLAAPERIHLVRGLGVQEGGYVPQVDDTGRVCPDAQVLSIDMWNMVRRGDLSSNVMLARNDILYVPANGFARVGLRLQTVLFPAQATVSAVRVPGDITGAPLP